MAHCLPPLLDAAFFARDALVVARELLGKELRHGPVRLRITETEAYRHPDDTANHARAGMTERNAAMWGPPGRAYVYLCYGVHHLLNLVTNEEGEGAAVLIRSCEPIAGLHVIQERRGGSAPGPELLAGPGKVAQALGIDLRFNHHRVCVRGGLEVREGPRRERVLAGPRVGIGYAAKEHQLAPWRLAVADSLHVSHRRSLVPLGG